MGEIVAVCSSKEKGERKQDIGSGLLLKGLGVEGDAHAGFGHRQVSLLAIESIQKMIDCGVKVGPGDFAENLTVSGLNLPSLPVGTRLAIGEEAILRVTQIGKECHSQCSIYHQIGKCIMPQEGIFAEVLYGGKVNKGDAIDPLPSYKFGIITASDKGAKGERDDKSGPLVAEMLLPWGDTVVYQVVPDERAQLVRMMKRMVDEDKVDLLITTGGTGFGPRDITPEATLEVVERLVPGIPEVMRSAGLKKTPRAMLSRAVAGICGHTLIINLPGSPRGVRENLEILLPVMQHALDILSGYSQDCGNVGLK